MGASTAYAKGIVNLVTINRRPAGRRATSPPWERGWRRSAGHARRGGQGTGFAAESTDGSGQRAFIKTLRRPRDIEARKRFRREVAAYETLTHDGIPRLLDHNSGDWGNTVVPLFLALELIRGSTLSEWVAANGALPFDTALVFGLSLADILAYCHSEDVLHRDLKPANVILRGDDAKSPVIVDFGLSFNVVEELGDVTRVGEEVGNRFLRLPEAWQNTTPISDVTQIAGLLFYALTGLEPHSLLDEANDPPHRRQPAFDLLRSSADTNRSFLRLMALFDRALTMPSAGRFQSAIELGQAITAVGAPEPDNSTMGGLESDFREYLEQQRSENAGVEAAAARLDPFVRRAMQVGQQLANENALQLAQSNYLYAASVQLALSPRTRPPPPYSKFDFESRGTTSVVMKVRDSEVWTGTEVEDPDLTSVIRSELMQAFLSHYRESQQADR
jgi:serine/threonine-protein kinase